MLSSGGNKGARVVSFGFVAKTEVTGLRCRCSINTITKELRTQEIRRLQTNLGLFNRPLSLVLAFKFFNVFIILFIINKCKIALCILRHAVQTMYQLDGQMNSLYDARKVLRLEYLTTVVNILIGLHALEAIEAYPSS